jgi:hypothetical protein
MKEDIDTLSRIIDDFRHECLIASYCDQIPDRSDIKNFVEEYFYAKTDAINKYGIEENNVYIHPISPDED